MADARTAILITIDPQHEGGFQNDRNDRANWTGGHIGVGELLGTKYGITALDLPGMIIADLTLDQAIAYYLAHYWKQFYSQIVNQDIANKLFDMGVLFGVGTAVTRLQAALNLPEDGDFGPKTLAMTNEVSPGLLLNTFKMMMLDHASAVASANLDEASFLPDWIRRINS